MGRLFTSLRSRLIVIVFLTSIPAILFLIQSGNYQRKQAMLAAQEEVVHLTKVASTMQATLVDSVKGVLLTLGHFPTFQAQDTTGCQAILSEMVDEHFEYYASFYVADLEGKILCSPPEKHVPPDFHTCQHYSNLVKATDFVISGYHICEYSGKSVLSIGYPVLNNENQPVLVINVSLDLAWFYDFAVQADLPSGAELIVIDEQGVILSHYPDNEKWGGYMLPNSSTLGALFEQKQGYRIGTGLNGEESILAISPLEGASKKIYVALSMPTEIVFAEANQNMKRNLVILLIVMGIVMGLMWLLGDSLIIKQAQTLVNATQKLAQGDLTTRSGLDYAHGELGQLALSFDSMAQQLSDRETERENNLKALSDYATSLEHSNQELRDFANIASHDLQEPLRKIQTFGELLQNRYQNQLDERGKNYIQRMRDAASRMQNLISELLSFARVTNRSVLFKEVDLQEITKHVLHDLDWQIEQNQAVIKVSELPTLEADPIQINQLMQNLIGNAIKFHKPGQPPTIRIYCGNPYCEPDENGMLDIRVEDDGLGFDEKYLDRIFQPFQRLHPRESIEGTGMGLAICRKIVDQHGGTITAQSKPDKGTTFIVRLPKIQPSERLENL
jgi:signal transduction histidine kinase